MSIHPPVFFIFFFPIPTTNFAIRSNIITQLNHQSKACGVKEDLSEIKQSLTRQFWGMATFLGPSPSPSHSPEHHRTRYHFNSSVSNQSDTRPSGNERHVEDGAAVSDCDVGNTEEVLAFATSYRRERRHRLEFFKIRDSVDFEMSEAQREHASAIERLAPRLAALRIELCPCHMSENYFWKVYFVLLHSRLNKQDAEILSTMQVMAARAMWMHELRKQMKLALFELFGRSTAYSRDATQHDNRPHGTRGYERTTAS
ncbi:BSD domain [Sesbania bispinosa]|nr:BSD domain [Sesbania bispinosa]